MCVPETLCVCLSCTVSGDRPGRAGEDREGSAGDGDTASCCQSPSCRSEVVWTLLSKHINNKCCNKDVFFKRYLNIPCLDMKEMIAIRSLFFFFSKKSNFRDEQGFILIPVIY